MSFPLQIGFQSSVGQTHVFTMNCGTGLKNSTVPRGVQHFWIQWTILQEGYCSSPAICSPIFRSSFQEMMFCTWQFPSQTLLCWACVPVYHMNMIGYFFPMHMYTMCTHGKTRVFFPKDAVRFSYISIIHIGNYCIWNLH